MYIDREGAVYTEKIALPNNGRQWVNKTVYVQKTCNGKTC